jgi:molybdopterin-guanine dinucleotide biosynthesis protein A
MTDMLDPSLVTGLVLTGGRGSRMGGVDKGLQSLNGKPMAQRVLQQLQTQCGHVMVNANRNLSAYQSFGAPVWPDTVADHAGPLAGFLVGLEHCPTPYLQTAPCDVPCFPTDLVQRLGQALLEAPADMAIATSTEVNPQGLAHAQRHPVFCLMRSSLRDSLSGFIHAGGRKIEDWCALHHCVEVNFGASTPDVPHFVNVNTSQELSRLQACLGGSTNP